MPLLVSIDQYNTLFENSLDAFFIAHPDDGSIVSANKAACAMFGYTKEEILTKGKKGLIDTVGPQFSMMAEERREQKKIVGVVTGIRNNGERFPMELSSILVENEKGIKYACTLATDISQKKSSDSLVEIVKDARIIHQKVEESRLLLENVLNSLSDGFIILNRNFTVLFWNIAVEKMLMKTADEVMEKNIWEELPDLGFLKNFKEFREMYEENKSIRFRDYFPRYKLWADVSVHPSDKYISVYIKDVTELKLLHTLEKLEREVLQMNASPDSVLEKTLDFFLKEIENIHDGMRCSVLRLKGNRLYKLSAPRLSEKFCKSIEAVEIGEGTSPCGTAACRREKVVIADVENDPLCIHWRECAALEDIKACCSLPITDSYNHVIGVFSIYFNKSKIPTQEEKNTFDRVKNLLTILVENKLSIEAVQYSNQSYDMVALATNDAIWDWDTQTDTLVRKGEGLKTLFGYELEESMRDDKFWHKRIHPDDFQAVFAKQKSILDNPNEVYWEDEYRFLKKNGQYAYVQDKGYIIRDQTGKAVRMLGATRDITERKENEALLTELNNRLKQRADELTASNVELERFAYLASHDMQEPLRMVTSFLQLFKNKYKDQIDETAEQYIHYAVDGAERMKKLIRDLLEYSKVGSIKDDFENIQPNDLVKEVVKVFLTAVVENKATITFDTLPAITASRTQIFQLFQNLVGNALKYHSDLPPEIHISGKEEDTHIQFSVRDNGIGIKPMYFEKVFVLFQRLHHKNEYSGTGIGLAICKKIVDRHHGKIWVESTPGQGSCFYFTIAKPLKDKFG